MMMFNYKGILNTKILPRLLYRIGKGKKITTQKKKI